MPYYIDRTPGGTKPAKDPKIVWKDEFWRLVKGAPRVIVGCAVLYGIWELWCLLIWLLALALRP